MAETVTLGTLLWEIAARDDGFSASLAKANSQLEMAKKKSQEMISEFESMARKSMIAGAAISAAFGYGVTKLSSFQTEMSRVAGLTDQANAKIDDLTEGVLKLGTDGRIGIGFEVLGAGMYDLISAGSDVNQVLDELRLASEAAIGGKGQGGVIPLKETIDGATTAMNAFGRENLTMEDALNVAMATVNVGKTTIGDFSGQVGEAVSLAAKLGVQYDELGAATATLTKVSGNTSKSMTQQKGILTQLLSPNDELKEIIKQTGYESSQSLIAVYGYQGALEILAKQAGYSGESLRKMFGEVEAVSGVLSLTGEKAKDAEKDLAAVRKEVASGTAISRGFQKQQEGVAQQIARVRNEFGRFAIEAGQTVLPEVLMLTEAMGDFFNNLNKLRETHPVLADTVTRLTALTGVGLTTLGVLGMITSQVVNLIVQMKALNVSMAITPWGAAAIGAGLLVTTLVSLATAWENAKIKKMDYMTPTEADTAGELALVNAEIIRVELKKLNDEWNKGKDAIDQYQNALKEGIAVNPGAIDRQRKVLTDFLDDIEEMSTDRSKGGLGFEILKPEELQGLREQISEVSNVDQVIQAFRNVESYVNRAADAEERRSQAESERIDKIVSNLPREIDARKLQLKVIEDQKIAVRAQIRELVEKGNLDEQDTARLSQLQMQLQQLEQQRARLVSPILTDSDEIDKATERIKELTRELGAMERATGVDSIGAKFAGLQASFGLEPEVNPAKMEQVKAEISRILSTLPESAKADLQSMEQEMFQALVEANQVSEAEQEAYWTRVVETADAGSTQLMDGLRALMSLRDAAHDRQMEQLGTELDAETKALETRDRLRQMGFEGEAGQYQFTEETRKKINESMLDEQIRIEGLVRQAETDSQAERIKIAQRTEMAILQARLDRVIAEMSLTTTDPAKLAELAAQRVQLENAIDELGIEQRMQNRDAELAHYRQIQEQMVGYAQQVGQLLIRTDMTGHEKIKQLREMLYQQMTNALIRHLTLGITARKTARATEGAIDTAANTKQVVETTATEATVTGITLSSSLQRIGAAIAEAVSWATANSAKILGIGALIGIPAAIGLGLAGKKSIQAAFGFEQGGRLKKGDTGYFEGMHDEIIAPEKTFLQVIQQPVQTVQQTIERMLVPVEKQVVVSQAVNRLMEERQPVAPVYPASFTGEGSAPENRSSSPQENTLPQQTINVTVHVGQGGYIMGDARFSQELARQVQGAVETELKRAGKKNVSELWTVEKSKKVGSI